MTRLFIPFLLLLGILGVASCHKDKDDPTVINGTVVDAKTGAPLEGVNIYGGIYRGSENIGDVNEVTDNEGRFSLQIGHDDGFSGLTIRKNNYVTKFAFGAGYESGQINEIKVVMHPRDAMLRLVYENTQGIERAIYLQAQSKTWLDEYWPLPFIVTQPYPYKCPPNHTDTINYPFTSDEQINLYWGFSSYQDVSQAPYRDSLYLNRGETSTYFISF